MVKRVLSILISSVLISFMCLPVYSVNDDDKNYSSILVLGDSISSGYGLEGYPDNLDGIRNYGNLIRDELKPDTYNNLAINGQTSSELLEKVENGQYDENINDADLILVTIGGNDILGMFTDSLKKAFQDENGKYQLVITDSDVLNNLVDKIINSQKDEEYTKACDNFKTNFIKLTSLIHEKNPDATVYFQTVYNPFSGVPYLSKIDNFAQKYISRINDGIRDNTKDENGNTLYEYIDVADFFKLRALQLTNIIRIDIHPNSTGHQMIYQMLSSAIKGKEIDSDQALAQANVDVSPEDTTPKVTTSQVTTPTETTTLETMTSETTIEQAEETNSQASNAKNILFTAMPTAILLCVIFMVVYLRLKRKTR